MEDIKPVFIEFQITLFGVYPLTVIIPFVYRYKPFGERITYNNKYYGQPKNIN
jgi:hypothetical protein